MNNKFIGAVAFTVGAAVGSFATWQLVKTTYEKITKEEIASVKEYYEGKYSDKEEGEETEHAITEDEKDISVYSSLVKPYVSPDIKQEIETFTEPYVIDPELINDSDYELVSLTYHADGVLTDDMNNIINDAEDYVGSDFAEHFGEHEEDAVHVRNDRLQIDYEIISSEMRYSDLKSINPRQMEAEWGETN